MNAVELAVPDENPPSSGKNNCLPKAIGVNPKLPEFQDDGAGTVIFIKAMAPLAVQIQSTVGFPASVLVAQMIWETNQGTSRLAKEKNNFGGISCGFDDKAELKAEEPWSLEALPTGLWKGVDYKFKQRCSTYRRMRKIVVDGVEKELDEGGRYLEFQHPFDSVLYGVNNMMSSRAYNDPSSTHISGKPLSEKMREWRATAGIGESARRFQNAKTVAEKNKMRDNILKILQGVYAPRTKDCKTCPKSNDKYESSLRSIIKQYRLEMIEKMKNC